MRRGGRHRLFLAASGFLALLALAAGLWWFTRLPPMRLDRVSFADLPGWALGDPRSALLAFRRSCTAIERRAKGETMGGAGYAGAAGDWRGVCAGVPAQADAGAARRFFEENFVPFAVRSREQSLFTGYYEPEISGSRTRHDAYQTPVYARPDDLVTVDLGLFSPAWQGEHTAGRVAGKNLVPYATRAEIDQDGLAHARTLLFASDPVGLLFLQIQGSGRVRLDDGSEIRIAYDGQNGRPYTAIGRTLIAAGELVRSEVSLGTIRTWLKAHPDAARAVMETDQSYVFFHEAPVGDPALGSPGSEGVGLTPDASLAVDLRLHALGAPFYVATAVPGDPQAWDRLLIAQDTGGAIRGAVRGDIFFGFGETAAMRAGNMKAPGKFYVLLPTPVAARLGASADFPGKTP